MSISQIHCAVFIALAMRASDQFSVLYKCEHKLLFKLLYTISPKHCGESGTSVNYTVKCSCIAVFKNLPCTGELHTIMCSHFEYDDYSHPRLLKYKWSNRPEHFWDCHPWSRLWRPEGGLRNGWLLVQAIDEELFFESHQTSWFPDHSVWKHNQRNSVSSSQGATRHMYWMTKWWTLIVDKNVNCVLWKIHT